MNDHELDDLLRRWEAPAAPEHLEARIFGARPSAWHWLLRGSVRIPVPVMLALLLLAGVWFAWSPKKNEAAKPAVHEVRLSDFQPVAEIKPRIIRSGEDK